MSLRMCTKLGVGLDELLLAMQGGRVVSAALTL